MVPVRSRPREAMTQDEWASQRFVLYNVAWKEYEALRELLDDRPGLHMTYREGTLEIMSPSRLHEIVKKLFARLLEMWAIERDVELLGYGETTFRKEAKARGLEPDECYSLGEMGERPDIAFEVDLTSDVVDKLDVYRGLGVPEVWAWKDGRIVVHRLGPKAYKTRRRSVLLPGLDLEALLEFMRYPNQHRAVRAYRDWLRANPGH